MNLDEYIYENKIIFNPKEKFIQDLKNIITLEKMEREVNQVIFLCVGTDKILGDCLGPLVGSKLTEIFDNYNIYNVDIYGKLKQNVNYLNIEKTLNKIKDYYNNPCIIVIDAALSKNENIGKIFVQKGKTVLGKGLNKNKIQIGDISIKAVVGKDMKIPKYNFKNLQTISLGLIMELSEIVAEGIFNVMQFI